MEFQRPQYYLCFILFSLLYYGSQAYVFYAGGRDGWVLNPSEEYNHWAGRNRFQVNDTIVFKYKKGSNSVLVVNKEGYDKCNKANPIKKFEDGDSVFKFDRSGPFYFISGTDDCCEKGQKLIVVVLAIRSPPHRPPSPPSVSPSPVSQPPVANQPSPAVSPHPAPKISPSSPSPVVSPAPANVPSYPTPASAPAPAKTSPTPSPANTPPSSPTSPSPSPATSTPGSSPPSPPASTPPSVPGSPGTPSANPPGSVNPSSSNETSPPPPSGSGAWDLAPSSLLVYAVIFVLSAALSGILGGQ